MRLFLFLKGAICTELLQLPQTHEALGVLLTAQKAVEYIYMCLRFVLLKWLPRKSVEPWKTDKFDLLVLLLMFQSLGVLHWTPSLWGWMGLGSCFRGWTHFLVSNLLGCSVGHGVSYCRGWLLPILTYLEADRISSCLNNSLTSSSAEIPHIYSHLLHHRGDQRW